MENSFSQKNQPILNKQEPIPQWKRPAIVPKPIGGSGNKVRKSIWKRSVPWQMTVGAILIVVSIFLTYFDAGEDEKESVVSLVSPEGIDDWNLYTNYTYDFEIAYPARESFKIGTTTDEWFVSEKDSSDYYVLSMRPLPQPIEFGPGFFIKIVKETDATNIQEFIASYYNQDYTVSPSEVVKAPNNHEWLTNVVTNSEFPLQECVYFSMKGRSVVVISHSCQPKYKEMFTKMAQYFMFSYSSLRL